MAYISGPETVKALSRIMQTVLCLAHSDWMTSVYGGDQRFYTIAKICKSGNPFEIGKRAFANYRGTGRSMACPVVHMDDAEHEEADCPVFRMDDAEREADWTNLCNRR